MIRQQQAPQPTTTFTTTAVNHHHHHHHEIMNLDATLAALITSTSNRNGQQNEMLRAIDELETLEKEEQNLAYKTNITQYLTELLTGQSYENSTAAIRSLDALEEAVPRRVCQHPFRKNDIVWVCRTCQADETCVLCHACFSQSNHEGHDVAFYHAQAGGCCDCGDPDGTLIV
jgi:Fe2+ transport system protein B